MRGAVGLAVGFAGLFLGVTPAGAAHQQDVGWITGGVSSEAEARTYPCPRTEAGGWERTGPVVCLDRRTDAWDLTWDFERGCTYDATGWHGDCLFDIDMGDHVRVWGTRGIVQVEFTLTWLHGETATPAPTTPAPTTPAPTTSPSPAEEPTPRPSSPSSPPSGPTAPTAPSPPPPPRTSSGGGAPPPTAPSPSPPAPHQPVAGGGSRAPSAPPSSDATSEPLAVPSETPVAVADVGDRGRGRGLGVVVVGLAAAAAAVAGVIAHRRRTPSTD